MSICPTLTCPVCLTVFPYRSNKTYCSPKCRKSSSQKERRKSRPANAANSRSVQRHQEEVFELAMRMAERLYTMPSGERLGYVKEVIDFARSGLSPITRQVLTMPKLLRPNPEEKHLFWRRCPVSYCTISQAADRYCRLFWKAGVVDVVRGKAPEPPTGEVVDEPCLAA